MEMKKAATEAIINGVVIGALVAGVMLFSGQVSNTVILRTTGAAMLMRFAFYMIENVEEVSAGAMGDYLGLKDTQKGSAVTLKSVHIGKLI